MEIDDTIEKQFQQIKAITDVLISYDCRNLERDTVSVMAEYINQALKVIRERIKVDE
jgi:hypothetical protein